MLYNNSFAKCFMCLIRTLLILYCYNFFFQERNLLDASTVAARGGSRIVAIERSTAMFILRTNLTIVESRVVTSPIPILVRYANTWRYVFELIMKLT